MSNVDFNLYLITDRLNLPNGTTLSGQIEAALRGGLKAVQLREKDLSPDELLPLAQEMRQLTLTYNAKLLINSCLQTALAVGADGVHLPGRNPAISEAREKLGANALIGVSTHAVAEIVTATDAGADFVTFGPVYPTASKVEYGDPVGIHNLQQACQTTSIPVFALGGVTHQRLPELRECGCHHFSCIGAVLQADDPEAAVRQFL